MSARNLAFAFGLWAIALVSAAKAEGTRRWFFSLEAGADYPAETSEVEPWQLDSAPVLLGTLGLETDEFRFEGEVAFRESDGANATLSQVSMLGNLLWFVEVSDKFSVAFGGGIGASLGRIREDTREDQSLALAYQGIAEARYRVSTQWSASLRYRATEANRYEWLNSLGDNETTSALSNSVTLGLSYAWASEDTNPRSKQRIEERVAPFESQKCNITAEVAAVLAEAAAAAKSSGSASIRVPDSALGTAAENKKLLECRADRVRQQLREHGVPDEAITIEGDEPLNLIVKIDFGTAMTARN